MPTEPVENIELPSWLREAMERGTPTDDAPDKRSEPRLFWASFYSVQPEAGTDSERFIVRGFNVSSAGIGFSSRQKLAEGQRLLLTPGDEPGEMVRIRVIHCTPTEPGMYKVGCAIEPE